MLEVLKREYGYNTPIFLNEIKIEGMSDSALRQSFRRMLENGVLARFDNGIYYIPKQSKLLGIQMSLDGSAVIEAKYIMRRNEVFGYFAGMTFANQIGLTMQVPAQDEIITNKESTKGRNIEVSYRRIRVKKPRVPVTKDNWKMLQLLDLLGEYEKWSELENDEVIKRIKEYIMIQGLSRTDMMYYAKYYPDRISKKLIESGLVYVFA